MAKKIYEVIPNFMFSVEAENEVEANDKAYEKLKNAGEITGGGFDFTIEDSGEVVDEE